jgi:Flp pilus assembly CpaE family ATPase
LGGTEMDDVARVVVAVGAPEVTEEVMHFLDRSGRARVIATASDGRQLEQAVRQLEPDAVVAEPGITVDGLDHQAIFALAPKESVASLRAAIRAGARAFYLWPSEREALIERIAKTFTARRALARRATVVAVHASRGGAGTTFVATHLAASLARAGKSCVLVEGDVVFGDLAPALGAPPEDIRTIGDLSPLGDELGWDHVRDVAWRHDAGFDAVLAPPATSLTAAAFGETVPAVVEAAATAVDVVVVAVPRSVQEPTGACLTLADRVLEVLILDVTSFLATKRALEVLAPLDLGSRLGLVVNQARRGDITTGDVVRVFGADPLAVIPFEAGAARAREQGRLVERGRAFRVLERLSLALVEPGVERGA